MGSAVIIYNNLARQVAKMLSLASKVGRFGSTRKHVYI